MKVFNLPEAVPYTKPDYANYDRKAEAAREAKHKSDLKKHLIEYGYTGKHTGKIVRLGVADGCAQYMLADGSGRYGNSFLIHLPYGDAYHYIGIQHFPKKAIIKLAESDEKMSSIFRRKVCDG